MKSLILIAALAALAVCHAASLPDEADLFEQYVDVYPQGATSRLSRAVLHEQEYYHEPIGNGVVSQEVIYIANATTLIMGVRVLTPPQIPELEGLGTNQVTVRLVSRPGLGFNSTVTLYGPWEF